VLFLNLVAATCHAVAEGWMTMLWADSPVFIKEHLGHVHTLIFLWAAWHLCLTLIK